MNLRHLLFITRFTAVLFCVNGFSQNVQDCVGAIPVCEGFYDQPNGYTGTGEIDNELPNSFSSCLTIDANSVWYVFTVEETGFLSFTLSPNGVDSDYDWILFDFSSGSCDDISTDESFIVSCNSYGDFALNGPTGISSAEGGTGNSNGPGNLNGPPFNQDVPVNQGETYLLYIQDWSGNSEGYTLDFTESTASIFDNDPPEIEQVSTNCAGNVSVSISENINCDNLTFEDFLINDNGIFYTPIEIISDCSASTNTVSEFTLVLDDSVELTPGSDLILEINQDEGLLNDACGNVITVLSFDFTVGDEPSFSTSQENPTCGEINGSFSIFNIENIQEPFEISVNGVLETDLISTGLAAGEYVIQITDNFGCIADQTVLMTEISLIDISAGADATSCSFTYNLEATSSEIVNFEWLDSPGVTFTDSNSLNTQVNVTNEGSYELVFSATNEDGCVITDVVEISFSNLTSNSILGDPVCGSSCEAEVTVNVADGVIPYLLTLDEVIQDSFDLSNICAGEHNYEIIDGIGCTIEGSFIIEEIESPILISTDVSNETCPELCNGSILINASNTSSISCPQLEIADGNFLQNLCAGDYQIILTSPDNCQEIFDLSIYTLSNLNAQLQTQVTPLTLDEPVIIAQDFSTGNYITSTIVVNDVIYPITDSFSLEIPLENPDGTPVLVELIIEDEYGCIDSDSRTVQFLTPLQVYIPNSFTPNNDNLNEVFFPSLKGFDPAQYELTIFNRWGEIIFQTNDPEKGWNGNYNSGDYYAEAGIYHYRLAAKQQYSPVEKLFIGHLLLIR